ncbi:hypothetical protein OIDMADRAFT_148926 [Oidiodendron maius Zn]|uniref:Uncharacterized protein n=1 Tax=Oidiodendron maius (strain Zn) TaxID=913774 RepID=A0A0C3GGK6_OIDMZ|nr:hypothetical protein OIDMADRAFT_148926 [Oidiodendron maius Zn]
MERKESSSRTNLEERIPPQSRVTSSHLDIHDEETLGQGPGGVELADTFHPGGPRSQATIGIERGKRAIKSQADCSGPPASLAPQAPQEHRNKEFKRSQSFPLKESRTKDPQSNRSYPSNEYYTKIESENKLLQKQLADHRTAFSSSQKLLAESKARGAQLREHLEEATATIFRLRPQRQEHTESEIQGDFHTLSESIKNWIEINCDGFLEDDHHGFETMLNRSIDGGPGVESILKRFQLKAQELIELKEHILAAIVMRYLFDEILNRPFSNLLKEGEEDLLTAIYESMATMEPPKGNLLHSYVLVITLTIYWLPDLPTIRTWKSDTATAIDSHPGFASRFQGIEEQHNISLYRCLQSVLSNQHNEQDTINSIYKGIVAPAITLARKVQSASSIWEFKYSEWCDCRPGELMAEISNFLAIIEDYRCINLSARAKQLKLATDLATVSQQRSLAYVLDIFPGLYCQRITPGGSQPKTTVSQPVLIVSFAPRISQQSTHHSDSRDMTNEQTRARVPTAPHSNRSGNAESRTANNSRAPPTAPVPSRPDGLESAKIVDEEGPPPGVMNRMDYKAERYNQRDRAMFDSGVEKSSHVHSQSSRYHTEGGGSRGEARKSRQPAPSHPAPQEEGFMGRVKKLWY